MRGHEGELMPPLLKTATVAGTSIKEINEKIAGTVEEQVGSHGRQRPPCFVVLENLQRNIRGA